MIAKIIMTIDNISKSLMRLPSFPPDSPKGLYVNEGFSLFAKSQPSTVLADSDIILPDFLIKCNMPKGINTEINDESFIDRFPRLCYSE